MDKFHKLDSIATEIQIGSAVLVIFTVSSYASDRLPPKMKSAVSLNIQSVVVLANPATSAPDNDEPCVPLGVMPAVDDSTEENDGSDDASDVLV
jgi:hypothetical protein